VVQAPGPWQWEPRERTHHNLWICLRGTGTMDIGRTSHAIRPGFGLVIAPRTIVRGRGASVHGMRNIAVHFHLPRRAAAAFRPWTERGVEVQQLPLLHQLAQYLQMLLLDAVPDPGETSAVARQMLRVFLRELQRPPEDALTRRIRQQAADLGLRPDTARPVGCLAREAGLSVSQYTRRFRDLFGTTPVRFLIDRRIDHARRLLRETTLGLDRIARELGYRDQTFFSRQFKAETGIAPRRHRRPSPDQA
jgi:AraC-like DNA-binding protein